MIDHKPRLLFIIPVHENNDCLMDTINNVTKFNADSDCYFVLNIAGSFVDFDAPRFLDLANVFVGRNLDQRRGYRYESQLESYIKAYTLAKQHIKDFDYVKFHHTSELFIKHGFYNYIKHYDFAYKDKNLEEPLPQRYYKIIELGTFKDVIDNYHIPDSYRYQLVEAAFYSKFVFDFIEDYVYNKLHTDVGSLNKIFDYTPIEEIVIPTLSIECAKKHSLRQGNNVLQYAIDIFNVKLEPWQFSIKHVPRDYNHPLRQEMRRK
jgi:hypothetical protein